MQNYKKSDFKSWRSSVVEQLTCNQQVGGSNPFASSTDFEGAGEVAEWTKAADCKSAGASLRRFESFPPHHLQNAGFRISHELTKMGTDKRGRIFVNSHALVANQKSAIDLAGVAQLARASAFQAEGRGFESRLPLHLYQAHVAQAVEHILGKDVVGGSSPPVGSRALL